MPTTTSLLAFVAQRLRVAASFNRPMTSGLDHINENSQNGIPAATELKNVLRSGDVSVSGSRQFRAFEE